MATKNLNLGRVPVSRGDFNLATTYYKDNIVQYQDASYQVTAESITGVTPINTEGIINTGWIIFSGSFYAYRWKTTNTPASDGKSEGNLKDLYQKTLNLEQEQIQGGIYDVSAHNDGAVFESLQALLSNINLDTLIPLAVRKGGMSIKFIQGSVPNSDNKYVQYRLMSDTFNTIEANWQGVDKIPTPGSTNLVKSGILGTRLERINKRIYTLNNTGGYISKSEGVVQTYENAVYSDFIPCEPGQRVRLNLIADDSLGVCFYTKPNEGSFIAGSGINAIDEAVTIPTNAYFLRASSRSNYVDPEVVFEDFKCLNDIPDYEVNKNWILFAEGSDTGIDTRIVVGDKYIGTRKNYYNFIKRIKLYGFDKTKKHTLYVLWNDTNLFSFRISEYDGTSWVVVFAYTYTDNYTSSEIFDIDYTDNLGKRVVARIECPTGINGYVFNQLSNNPEYVFDKCCYYEQYTGIGGVNINKGKISVNINELPVQDKVLNGDCFTYNIPISKVNISGYINKNGGIDSHPTYMCSDFMPVVGGQIYFSNTTQFDNACIGFYNQNKQFQSYIQLGDVPQTFTIPEGISWMRLSNGNPKAGTTILTNPEYIGLKELTNIAKNSVTPIATPTKLFPKTKLPCISFQFDDCPDKDSEVVALFKEYGKTCAFAFIASESNINAKGSQYIKWQKEGFQIMNHSINAEIFNTTNYTYSTALEAIMTARQRIDKAGMVCNGFVAPSSSMASEFMPILGIAHCYAFTTSTNSTTANGRNTDISDLHRYPMQGNTLSQIENFIDGCIENDQIITLYGHANDLIDGGTDEQWSIAKIRALIEYCITKEQIGELYFRGTDECIKYFFDL